MRRPELWCQVIGWLQVIGGGLIGAAIFGISALFQLGSEDMGALVIVPILFFIFGALPAILAGWLVLRFAGLVKLSRDGQAAPDHMGLRIAMGLAGLWSAGVIGIFGFSAPPLSFFAVLGLLTTGLAWLGADGTAALAE